MSPIEITKENFKSEVLESDVPVLLDLWAAWCGPCRLVAPVVDQLADEYAGRIKVGKIDVDDQPGARVPVAIVSSGGSHP